MCCCIHLCPCACKIVSRVCPSQMGGNATSNYCPYLAELRPQCHSIGGCVCPNLVKNCPNVSTGIFNNPGAQILKNAPGQAAHAVYTAGIAAWCAIKKDFNSVPWLGIGLVIFAMLLVLIFVYGYARSR